MKKIHIQNILLILCVLIVFPATSQAQLTLGQYRDEAPLRTWNIFGVATAASTGMGYTRYAYNTDLSSSLTNPALLTQLPQFSVALHGAYNSVELYKFGVANTGLLTSEENVSFDYYFLNLSGLSVNYKGWGLAFTISIPELYDRPTAQVQEYYEDIVVYFFEFRQEGYIRNYNLSISRQITNQIAVGLGFNYENGRRERNWEARYIYDQKTLFDDKVYELKGYYLNGGIVFDLNQELSLAAVFRTPYTRKADSYSSIRNLTIPTIDIRTEVKAESRFKQPLVLGAGLNYSPFDYFRIAVDASYFNWGKYEVELFEEPVPVEFKNILTINAGGEYVATLGQSFQMPIWFGFAYDPQPMTDVDSKYYYLTGGLGFRIGGFFLEGGYMYGWESGSGNDLKAQRVAVTLGYKR